MAYIVEDVFESGVLEDAVFTSVHTDKVFEFDLTNKVIRLKAGVTEYHPVDDLYREFRYHRANDESLRIFSPWLEAAGNISKGGGKFTARLAIFKNGWKIVPANESHTLKVTGEQISDIGESGVQVMNLTSHDSGVNVSIEYAPPDTEIIKLGGDVAIAQADIDAISSQVWTETTRELTGSALTSSDVQAIVDNLENAISLMIGNPDPDADLVSKLTTLDSGIRQVLTNLGSEIDINEVLITNASKSMQVTI